MYWLKTTQLVAGINQHLEKNEVVEIGASTGRSSA